MADLNTELANPRTAGFASGTWIFESTIVDLPSGFTIMEASAKVMTQNGDVLSKSRRPDSG
jgi:hypothetical protein